MIIVAAFNVNMNTQNENLSDLNLANVDALAHRENIIDENTNSDKKPVLYYVNPCAKHSGNECNSKSSPYGCASSSNC